MHTTVILNVFVPAGNDTVPQTIIDGIDPYCVSSDCTGTVVVSVFEYRMLTAIICHTRSYDNIIITNPEVFSCGRYYSANEYKKILAKTFTDDKQTIFDVNPIYSEISNQGRSTIPQIRFSNVHDEVNFVNSSILTTFQMQSEYPDYTCKIPTTAAKHIGTVMVAIGPFKSSDHNMIAGSAVDINHKTDNSVVPADNCPALIIGDASVDKNTIISHDTPANIETPVDAPVAGTAVNSSGSPQPASCVAACCRCGIFNSQ